ncbi:MAG: HlyD family secretion protein [Desulfobacteraceae bacterium]|nr:HlyD family secretion protein [Desulfobacteraceae bacterium]
MPPQTGGEQVRGKSRLNRTAIVTIALLVLGAGYWWFLNRNTVSTDNAYVKADSAQISVRVPGTVLSVLVENDSPVREGQVLLQLDPADYRVALNRAQAALEQGEAEVKAAEIAVPQTDTKTEAEIRAAQAALKAARENEIEAVHKLAELKNSREAVSADLSQVQRDAERFARLYREGAGTERQNEQAGTALKKSRAQMAAVDSQVAAVEASLAAIREQVDRARAQLQSAHGDRYSVEIQNRKLESLKAKRDRSKAELDAAGLNLSYCTVVAPLSGVVAQKSIQVGDRVQPGQALMAVVPLQEAYIEANFKETQLTNVRLGQPARIRADIYPGRTYHGRVVGIRAGTGAAFSLLPAENATGNWIKVVQRIPVRIRLDGPPPPEYPLRVGLSLDVSIDTSDTSGSRLVPEPKAQATAQPAPKQ